MASPGGRRRSFPLSKTANMKGSQKRESSYDARVDHRAFRSCHCVAGRNASQQGAIAVFISVVRDLLRRKRRTWCHVLLLHELGAVQDNNARHRRKLRRQPVLPWASDTAPASRVGKTASSPARLRALSPRRAATLAWISTDRN